MTAPHYPTSAELAALRWAFHEAKSFSCPDQVHCPLDYPRDGRWYLCGLMWELGSGAWPHEREHGIGYSGLVSPITPTHTEHAPFFRSLNGARRESNRLRFEQYQHDSILALSDPGTSDGLTAAIRTFVPRRYI